MRTLPAGSARRDFERVLRLLQLPQCARAALVEGDALLGKGQYPRRAVAQSNPVPRLQPRHRLADRRAGQVQPRGGGGEAARLRHGDEFANATQPIRHGVPL